MGYIRSCEKQALNGVRDNEATVQAEFYHWGRVLGLRSVLELNTPVGRVDLAVISDDGLRLLCVVECKSPNRGYGMSETAQIKRYKQLGVDVYGLWKMEAAREMVLEIIARKYDGKLISDVMAVPPVRRMRRKKQPADPMSYIGDLNIRSGRPW